MRKVPFAAVLMGALAVAGPAAAGIMVIGSSAGRQCYIAARDGDITKAAVDACDQALAQGDLNVDDRASTHVNRGVILLHSGRHAAAIADFDRAMAIKPSEPESYLNKAAALLRTGAHAAEAKSLFSKALEQKTRRPELAFFGRAITHEATGDVKSAYRDYLRAQEAAPKWGLPRRELSRFQVKRASSSL